MVNFYCLRLHNCHSINELSVRSLRSSLNTIFGEPDGSQRKNGYCNYVVRESDGAIEFIADESFVPQERARYILGLLNYTETDKSADVSKLVRQTA